MKYKINVQKFVENPKYTEQFEEYRQKTRYAGNFDAVVPSEIISTTALECELTDEQFTAIKKVVLDVF